MIERYGVRDWPMVRVGFDPAVEVPEDWPDPSAYWIWGTVVVNVASETVANGFSAIRDSSGLVWGDAAPLDHTPDACWRCDARSASTEVGLCGGCHADLTHREWTP